VSENIYVLVHGSWHGAWCWYKVAALLEKAGHRAVALDLPGHGRDRTPHAEVTLKAYVDRILDVLDAQPEAGILVGHSMGGVPITQGAEYRPDKIKTLVYLAAFLPRNGESLAKLSGQDKGSLVPAARIISGNGTFTTLKTEALKNTFYGDCPEEDIALARAALTPQPLAPGATPVSTTQENFGRVPRVYMTTLFDRALTPEMQKRMFTALPCRQVIPLHTGHSPFFSAPGELVRHLTAL